MVVVLGMVSRPLPAMVPPVHVCVAPVRVIGAVPASVPPCMLSVATESVEAPLRVRVPPVTVTLPVLAMVPMVVAVAAFCVVPVTL